MVNLAATFDRVRDAYDLDWLATSTLVYAGVGGAAAFAEDLARAGVGRHVLIDPDTVSETNIATQQVYRRDIGRPKVEALADRIRDINPAARVMTFQRRIEDVPLDLLETLRDEHAPDQGATRQGNLVMLGLSDNFYAQARVNLLALHLGVPSLCAQVYWEGRAGEITFTYPGATHACHRCILSTRYEAFLEQGYTNEVTSHGSPIVATTRLNALKGYITLALLHHQPGAAAAGATSAGSKRWSGLVPRIGNRNLVQIRMDPDLEASLGLTVFNRVLGGADRDRILFDETVWLPQAADPGCPDCGGSGDLRAAWGCLASSKEGSSAHG